MTESRTLQFESPRALQSLYANDLKLLKNLEDSLGVKVTTREGWVKLEGDPSRIDKAQQVFQQLEQARQQGVDIQKQDLVFGIGPAGTGKTYLAVAMAVAALKKEQVARIILARPAVEAGE